MTWLYFSLLLIIPAVIFYVLVRAGATSENKSTKLILITTAIIVPIISLVMYQQRGFSDEVALFESMKALNSKVTHGNPASGSSSAKGSSTAAMKEFQRQLEDITDAKPDKAEYWYLLGSLHSEMQDFKAAVNAYQEASRLFPNDISIHARLAEARFLADNYMLTDAVRTHIDRVLSENPFDTTVLGILGISAYRTGQFETAIRFWEKSLQALPPMSQAAQSVRSSIEQAKVAGGVNSVPSEVGSDQAGLTIELDVSLDTSVQENSHITPNTAVFVFARQFGGPPMPVAVERITAKQLPLKIQLNDSKVMIKGRKLSDFSQLELVARLSFSGQPGASKGDYQTVVGPVDPNEVDGAIRLIISEIVTE